MRLVAFKGATAYEVQIGPVCLTFVHLMGGRWRLFTPPWKRLRFWIASE